MDELKALRDLYNDAANGQYTPKDGRQFDTILNSLYSNFDARAIVVKIQSNHHNNSTIKSCAAQNGWMFDLSQDEATALIGQYAYRYSEDIRKDRDKWQSLAMAFHAAVHAEAEKRKECEI